MKIVETNGTFEEAIAKSSVPAQEFARQVRALIVRIYPDVVMVPWKRQQTVGFGVGPKKMSEHFCYIGAYRHHVNLGFNYGADLPDPENLLEGTGKKFRKVKIDGVDQLELPALRQLIEAAIQERKTFLASI